MDLFIKPTDYAEDLPYSRLILGIHVIHRGYDMWSLIGVGSGLGYGLFKTIRSSSSSSSSPKTPSPISSPLISQILRFSSRTSLFGLAFGAFALTGVMWNKDLIGWQDRSWRLLQNQTQNQTDHWSFIGITIGALAGYTYTIKQNKAQIISSIGNLSNSRIILGSAATGGTIAMLSMLAVRALFESGKNVKAMQ